MKAFTDHDLKYLKEECAKGKGPYWLPVGLEEDKNVTLLINRLEAAEKLVDVLWNGSITNSDDLDKAGVLERRWRKAAGK
jgi:hypothetical protein